MIVKMKFVNIIGVPGDFLDVASSYIMNGQIELKNPLEFFKSNKGFIHNTEQNPYERLQRKFINLFEYAKLDYKGIKSVKSAALNKEEMERYADKVEDRIVDIRGKIEKLEHEKKQCEMVLNTLLPITHADVNINELISMKFMKFRFGRLPLDSYNKKMDYLTDLPTYFVVISRDKAYVWGFYFVYYKNYKRIDNVFSSIYFERIRIVGDTNGTAVEISNRIMNRLQEIERYRFALEFEFQNVMKNEQRQISEKFSLIKYHYELHALKKFAVYSDNSFYLVGWMPEKDAKELERVSKSDTRITVILDDPKTVATTERIPTKINNPKIFRPFEEFVKMYGIPRYNEIDPTVILGVAYISFFGMMFGDIGHGFCLTVFGLSMIFLKKLGFLAPILAMVGVSAFIFGLMYGTCFGFEGSRGIIEPLWFTPMENSTNMNKALGYAIMLGTAVIIFSIIINICNGLKQKSYKKVLFSQNGFAGLTFYLLSLYLIYQKFVFGEIRRFLFSMSVLAIMLVFMFLQEPLAKLMRKKKDENEHWSIVEAFFELFEILLGFVTNTISFVRLGAFALNHAGMMSVVLLFMEKLQGGSSLIMAIFGNVLVMGLEGLIVGIQALRLGYYEMFSRFYDGDGYLFTPTGE